MSIGAWLPREQDVTEFAASQKEAADTILAEAAQAASRLGIEAEFVHVPDATPAEAIVKLATDMACSLISISSHGRRGVSRFVLGSQTAEVLAHSSVPVLVIK